MNNTIEDMICNIQTAMLPMTEDNKISMVPTARTKYYLLLLSSISERLYSDKGYTDYNFNIDRLQVYDRRKNEYTDSFNTLEFDVSSNSNYIYIRNDFRIYDNKGNTTFWKYNFIWKIKLDELAAINDIMNKLTSIDLENKITCYYDYHDCLC